MYAPLKSERTTAVRLNDGEKLTLLMLCEIYDHLKVKGETDIELIRSAIHDGHLWGLEEKMTGVFHGSEPDPEIVSETTDILWMWDIIEDSFQRLAPEDQKKVTEGVPKHLSDVKFGGFDGNNEGDHLSVAAFTIEKLGKFSRFKNRELNSHLPVTLEHYRSMYRAFEPLVKGGDGVLKVDDIVAVIKAGQ